ncbi:MAG: hypothetical protein OEV21_04760 [Thermoplasmata archaeon]|nr:hypothetical protein [Thermoplasmata archaeon]
MRKVGVLISDAKLMFELIEALRANGVPFEIVNSSREIPHDIGALITTDQDAPPKCHCRMLKCNIEKVPQIIKEIKAALLLDGTIRNLTIGIDPGIKTGVAVLADHSLIDTTVVKSPEAVSNLVKEYLDYYRCDQVLVRIGNGDRTRRNRIFNAIWDMGIPIEIVDESNTSRISDHGDEDAAIEIALTPGYRPVKRQKILPSDGEISDIQRKSRISSNGELTISRSLAEAVARGEISMDEAIEHQKSMRKERNGSHASNNTCT